ncbi:MAG TPA: response regulator transcription factor [Saprospiraceae bacterium]|nr:response regulator transcription factor [Saprospiraceae bacterium]HRW74601.1 response regulator transcription factor [Saprospiraceae bacterium]
MNQHILIVEDEASIRESLALNLELEGYQVTLADDAQKAIDLFQSQRFDLILLDIMLPGLSGLDLCAHFRLTDRTVPIMLLTARDTPEDRIIGLRTGADDYLTKPFHLEELLLRIANLLRRYPQSANKPEPEDIYEFGPYRIDFSAFEAKTNQGTIELTRKEVALLRLLIDRSNEAVSRQQILHIVWGYEVAPSTRTIDNFILSFRKYFETDHRSPRHFHSIRGFGYKFTP